MLEKCILLHFIKVNITKEEDSESPGILVSLVGDKG